MTITVSRINQKSFERDCDELGVRAEYEAPMFSDISRKSPIGIQDLTDEEIMHRYIVPLGRITANGINKIMEATRGEESTNYILQKKCWNVPSLFKC